MRTTTFLIAVFTAVPVFAINSLNITRLTDDNNANNAPVWSPDGETITFHSFTSDGEVDIFSIPATGGEIKRVSAWEGLQALPCYSPDGEKIAFMGVFTGKHGKDDDIFVMPADGGSYTGLITERGYAGFPVWSPDGSKVVFVSDRSSTTGYDYLWIIELASGNIYKLNEGFGFAERRGAWSPDGSRIAYSATVSKELHDSDLFIKDLTTGESTNLTDTPGIEENWPTWSPDGRYIAYERTADADWDIYIISTETGKSVELIATNASEYSPAWASGSNRLAYTAGKNGGSRDIYVLLIDESTLESLSSNE